MQTLNLWLDKWARHQVQCYLRVDTKNRWVLHWAAYKNLFILKLLNSKAVWVVICWFDDLTWFFLPPSLSTCAKHEHIFCCWMCHKNILLCGLIWPEISVVARLLWAQIENILSLMVGAACLFLSGDCSDQQWQCSMFSNGLSGALVHPHDSVFLFEIIVCVLLLAHTAQEMPEWERWEISRARTRKKWV